MYPAPHGAVCARLLAPVFAANIKALESRTPGSKLIEKYLEISRILTGDRHAKPLDGAAWLAALTEDLRIPRLGQYGITPKQIPGLVEQAAKASSMKANPIALTDEEMSSILAESI
jgi:alcohol dehydrogenase class IV